MEDSKNDTHNKPNVNDHLANERTHLAWIRTSIGIMAFGFVVVKFSLFMKQISFLLGKQIALPPQSNYSSMIGILLVAFGTVILFFSYLKYKKIEKQLDSASYQSSSVLILSLTIILFVISLLLIVYLIEYIMRY